MKKPKELNRSIDLPLEEQFRENWGWEDSSQRELVDCDFLDLSYFTSQDPDDLIRLVRKMDNFLRERGISECYLKNYYLAVRAFYALDEEEDSNKSRNYYDPDEDPDPFGTHYY